LSAPFKFQGPERGNPPRGRGCRRKQAERSGKSPASFRSGGDVAGRVQDAERQPRRCRGVVGAVDKGAAAGCASTVPARYRLFGSTEERRSAGGLPKDDGIVPTGSATLVSHGERAVRARQTGGRPQGVREIN